MMRLTVLLVGVLFLSGCGGLEDPNGLPPGGGTGGDGGSCGDTWASYGSGFFNSYCAHCHFSQFGTVANVRASSSSISSDISSGRMPRGSGLSSTDRTRILAYLGCGAP